MCDKNDSLISGFGEIKHSENNIILLFSLGSGKTTLINKLCGKDFITNNKDFSCIRERQFAHSLTNNVYIFDFQGLNDTDDIAKESKIEKIF